MNDGLGSVCGMLEGPMMEGPDECGAEVCVADAEGQDFVAAAAVPVRTFRPPLLAWPSLPV